MDKLPLEQGFNRAVNIYKGRVVGLLKVVLLNLTLLVIILAFIKYPLTTTSYFSGMITGVLAAIYFKKIRNYLLDIRENFKQKKIIKSSK